MKFIPDTVESIYNFVFSSFKPHYFEGYDSNFKEATTQLDNLLPKDSPSFGELNTFVTNAINKAFHKRKNNKIFISNIMEMDREMAIKYIFSLMHLMEVPVIILEGKEIYSTFENHNSENVYDSSYWCALYSLFILLLGDKKDCDNISVCKYYDCNRIDKRCHDNPLNRANDDMLCPLVALWNIWQLSEKRIIYKKEK